MENIDTKLYDKILFASKGKDLLPPNIKKELQLISLDYDKAKIIGSFNYKIQLFPGDIDIYEEVDLMANEDFRKEFVKGIQKIVKDYKKSPQHYFMELKCGIDERYAIRPGQFDKEKNAYKYYETFEYHIKELESSNLLSTEQTNHILSLFQNLKETGNFTIHYEIKEIMRQLSVVRWNYNEIIKNKKILKGNRIMTLDEALMSGGRINIEALININGLISDISNFLIVTLVDEKRDRKFPINFGEKHPEEKLENFLLENLRKGIFIVDMPFNMNLFKMIKRMWSLARLEKNKKELEKLSPIISSYVSFVSQLKSNLMSFARFLQSDYVLPKGLGLSTLNIIHGKLLNVQFVNDNLTELFYKVFEEIREILNKNKLNRKDRDKIIIKLNSMIKPLTIQANNLSLKYLIKVGIIRSDVLNEFYKKYGCYPLRKYYYPEYIYNYLFNENGSLKIKHETYNAPIEYV